MTREEYEDWIGYERYPGLDCSISNNFVLVDDPEFTAYVNFRRYDFGEMCFFHLHPKRQMTAGMYRRFKSAIPEMERRLACWGAPIFAFFGTVGDNGIGIDSDNPRRDRFARGLGWESLGKCQWVNDQPITIYRYKGHLKDI